MSAWKQFTTKDVTITPFTADKGFTFTGNEIIDSENGINIYDGRNVNYTSSLNIQTGFEYSSSVNSIWNSAKQLYYTNYISSSRGDFVNTGSILPGVTREDDRSIGNIESPLYDNYLQSSLLQERYWNTGSEQNTPISRITSISIPTKLYGEKVIPGTFLFSTTTPDYPTGITLKDDGEGNIISGSQDVVIGQIFYSHGMVILTRDARSTNIGKAINSNPTLLGDTTIAFSSSLTIYEQQYKCVILENELGYSLNPSLLTQSIPGNSSEQYYPFVTGSFFEPYVTCVGLYNESQQLVAVGKLSFPLPVSQFTDTTVIVNFDV